MYSERVGKLKKSFVREILKVIADDSIISFAGGLPDPTLFPIEDIERATQVTLAKDGASSLQYAATEGHEKLRQFIIDRYYSHTNYSTKNILITTGSQQALDLLGKLFIDKGDKIVLESPGYLGAIQAFSVYQPEFLSVDLQKEGLNLTELETALAEKPKLLYTVSNFQNPSGLTYSKENRQSVVEQIEKTETLIIDDNPYGEINFSKEPIQRFVDLNSSKVISLGSFSKIFAPSMRLGWVAAEEDIIEKLVLLKQGSDLHTNYFSQCVLYNYLADADLDPHINRIRDSYRNKRDLMIDAIKAYFPKEVEYTEPTGGMFLWVSLPKPYTASELLKTCMDRGVIFVPGDEFYTDDEKNNSFRMNYTNSSPEDIDKGVRILSEEIKSLIK